MDQGGRFMSRLLRSIGGFAFLLTVICATGAAQDSSSERVITGRRIRYPTFELQVLVDGRPLTEQHTRGRTYVEALQGAEYELRLRNGSPDRVAVALSVDGLNTIDAEQSSAWNASKWVIEPYQTITISGWQMSSERARRFYFTTERDSYAAKLGRRTDLGVISAVFFRERRRVTPVTRSNAPSSGESMRAETGSVASSKRRDSQAATGIGRSVRHEVQWIDMELDSRPAAEFTIRYEFSRYSRGRFAPEP